MSQAAPLLLYQEDRVRVLQGLRAGRLEYADLTSWGFLDRFFALWIEQGFFRWAGETFPSPRERHHVPVWVLLAAFVQLKLHTEVAFRRLPYVLQSASILRTLGVQLGVPGGDGGFNRRHRKPRRGPVDQDTVRKFLKDAEDGGGAGLVYRGGGGVVTGAPGVRGGGHRHSRCDPAAGAGQSALRVLGGPAAHA